MTPPHSRPPYLEKADPGITPAGWYTVADGRELWWDGQTWIVTAAITSYQPAHPTQMVTREPVQTNHVLHLLLTVLTCGLWAPVWALVAVVNAYSEKRSVSHYR